jgi:hypothetical protein
MAGKLIFAGAGLTFLGIGLRSFYFGWICRNWMIYRGVITESYLKAENGADGTNYKPVIEYSFEVNGQEIKGTRLIFGIETNSKEYSAKMLDRYPMGREVFVFYDPKSGKMTLESGASEGAYFMCFMGLVLLFIGLLMSNGNG